MSELEIRRRKVYGIVISEVSEVVDRNPDPLATVGFTVVATALGAVLRKAFDDHLVSCPVCATTKATFECPEAERLFWLMPPGDTVLIG